MIRICLYLVLLTFLLLWPFRFAWNNADWMSGSRGISFSFPGQALSLKPATKLNESILNGSGFTLEVWVSADNSLQSGPARIATYSSDPRNRNFTLAQDGKKLVSRIRTSDKDLNGTAHQIEIDDVFYSTKVRHIVVASDHVKQTVFVDGNCKVRKDIEVGRLRSWDPSYHLVLGNEATGDRPWNGKIYYMAVYDRRLDEPEIRRNFLKGRQNAGRYVNGQQSTAGRPIVEYLFRKGAGKTIEDSSRVGYPLDMVIPVGIRDINKQYLALPDAPYSRRSMADLLINFILFVPFGYLVHSTLRRRYGSSLMASTVTISCGLLFILAVETFQFFMPTRVSSLSDLLSNITGVVIGILGERFISK